MYTRMINITLDGNIYTSQNEKFQLQLFYPPVVQIFVEKIRIIDLIIMK